MTYNSCIIEINFNFLLQLKSGKCGSWPIELYVNFMFLYLVFWLSSGHSYIFELLIILSEKRNDVSSGNFISLYVVNLCIQYSSILYCGTEGCVGCNHFFFFYGKIVCRSFSKRPGVYFIFQYLFIARCSLRNFRHFEKKFVILYAIYIYAILFMIYILLRCIYSYNNF